MKRKYSESENREEEEEAEDNVSLVVNSNVEVHGNNDTVTTAMVNQHEEMIIEPVVSQTTTTTPGVGASTSSLILYQESIMASTIPSTPQQQQQQQEQPTVLGIVTHHHENPWESLRSKLLPPVGGSYAEGLEALLDLCDKVHLIQSSDYPMFVATILPIFKLVMNTIPCVPPHRQWHDSPSTLSNIGASSSSSSSSSKNAETPIVESMTTTTSETMIPPSSSTTFDDPWSLPLILSPEDAFFSSIPQKEDNIEYQIRHAILTLCTKLPQNDILRPFASTLLLISMDVLHKDYEENGILASKLIFDLHRTYRNLLSEHVPTFFEFCIQLYTNIVSMTREKNQDGYETWMQLWCPFVLTTSLSSSASKEDEKDYDSKMQTVSSVQQDMNDTVSFNTIIMNETSSTSHPIVTHHPLSMEQCMDEEKESIPHMESHEDKCPHPIQKVLDDETTMTMDPPIVLPLNKDRLDSPCMLQSPKKSSAADAVMITNADDSNPVPVADPLKSLVMDVAIPPVNSGAPLVEGSQSSGTIDVSSSHLLNYVPPKAIKSYRVLNECPLTIMLLFQLYPKCIKNYLPQLLPFMMESLFQRPPTFNMIPKVINSVSRDIHPLRIYTLQDIHHPLDGPMKQKMFQTRTKELLSVQVKTLSFVTYLLKGFSDKLKPYEERLCTSVMNILSMIPRDSLIIRREALVCLGHIFATDYRKGFFRHVDFLLDERILLGSSRQQQGESSYIDLRPIAFRALADFLHHLRSKLSMAQVSKVVQLYSKLLHDVMMNMSLPMKALSIRMLLNMVDHAFQNKEGKASLGRDIMFRILEASVNMLGAIVANGLQKYITLHCSMKESTFCPHDDKLSSKVVSGIDDQKLDQIRDLVRPIIVGSKNLFFCINNYGHQREKNRKDIISNLNSNPGHADDVENKQRSGYDDSSLQKFTVSELELIGKYFEWGLDALTLFKNVTDDVSSQSEHRSQSKKDVLSEFEYFAASLVVLEGHCFHKVVGSRIQLLLDRVVDDDTFMSIPKYLLSKNSNSSRDLLVCILPILLCRSPYVSPSSDCKPDAPDCKDGSRRSEAMFHLFETFFSSLTLFPKNESALRPFIQVIVSECIRCATADYPNVSAHSLRHVMILRSMFRAISGGKFEESYKEILPILSTFLNGLYRIYVVTRNMQLRLSILELSLSIPARLSCLLPHLPLLLRFIVPAINSGVGEITNLA